MNFNTKLLHGGFSPEKGTGSTITPIYQVSAFAQESAEKLEKVFANKAHGYSYTRIANPTVSQFEHRINCIEGGAGAVACSSGMAAVTMSLLNILSAGDEVIASSALYGGTIDLFGDLKPFGITVKYAENMDADTVGSIISENTKAVFTEMIGNPRLDIADIENVAELLHSRKSPVPLIVDATTATPYLVRAFDYGADIVIHSASKYINGSGDAISGIIVDSGNFRWDPARYQGFENYMCFGKFAFIAKLRNSIWRNTGSCLAPMNAFMNCIGLETLGLRMERLCENAKALAEFFESKGVDVNYPSLASSPYHDRCMKYLGGKGGAILTIRTGSKEKAFKLINSLKYALIATNIGDVRTLAIHPASTIYLHSERERMYAAGVYEDSVRISVGIEDKEDLISDFSQALERI